MCPRNDGVAFAIAFLVAAPPVEVAALGSAALSFSRIRLS